MRYVGENFQRSRVYGQERQRDDGAYEHLPGCKTWARFSGEEKRCYYACEGVRTQGKRMLPGKQVGKRGAAKESDPKKRKVEQYGEVNPD